MPTTSIDEALAWGRYFSYDIDSGARRGPEAMRAEVDGIFDPSEPKQLRWRGVFHGWNKSVEVFDLSLRGLLAKAPEGTTAHVWASFWSRRDWKSTATDLHKAVEEGWRVWRYQLGFRHPRDVDRDDYAFATVLTGGEMSYIDAGHAADGLEGFMMERILALRRASGGTVVYPGNIAYKPGCRKPAVNLESTKRLTQGVRESFPKATDKQRDELVSLLHWKGRRAFVVLCVAFLKPEEMEAARAEHSTIKSAIPWPVRKAASKERKAKRAEELAAEEGLRAKRRRTSLSDVTNIGGEHFSG